MPSERYERETSCSGRRMPFLCLLVHCCTSFLLFYHLYSETLCMRIPKDSHTGQDSHVHLGRPRIHHNAVLLGCIASSKPSVLVELCLLLCISLLFYPARQYLTVQSPFFCAPLFLRPNASVICFRLPLTALLTRWMATTMRGCCIHGEIALLRRDLILLWRFRTSLRIETGAVHLNCALHWWLVCEWMVDEAV